MYRFQFHVQVRMGHWRDFQSLVDGLNEALEGMGLVPFQVWEAAFGRLDAALLVADYDSLATYEREHDLMHADATCMEVWRAMAAHTDVAPWTDLWWRPTGGR